MDKRALAAALVLGSLFINTLSSNAQVVPPSNVEAGVVNKSTTKVEKTNSNQPDVQNLVDQKKEEDTNDNSSKVTFKLNEIRYSGNTLFTNEDLHNVDSAYVGKDVTLGQLKQLIKNITVLYNDKGYITSFAFLPAQKIKNGIVEISISEGKIGKINIEGNKHSNASYLKNNMLKANGIEEGKIFNVRNLRKSLGEINEKDYIKGQITLQKGQVGENSDLTLDVEEQSPFSLTPGYDNKGRDLIGIQRGTLRADYKNLTGYGDSISATTVFAKSTFGLGTQYRLPIGPYGTELQFGYGYSNVALGGRYKDLDIHGHSNRYTTTIMQPIFKGERLTLNTDLSLDMINSTTNWYGSDIYDKYRTRPIRLGLNAVKDDNTGRFVSRFETSVGLPWLGATQDADAGIGVGSPKFVKFTQSLIRLQNLPLKTLGIFTLVGQYSPNALLPMEQLAIGGADTVRGYKEACLLGDSGYYMNLELRRTIPYLPDYKYLRLKDRIQLAAFYDQGFARSTHQGISEHQENFLQDVGVGLRIFLTKYLSANLDMGIPLGKDKYPEQSGARFHFGISSNMF
jgi:hemolysin activation/secretion protein